jgi:ribosomal protein S27AE
MSQRVQEVSSFYIQHSGRYFCDKCVSELTGVKPPNQVNQIARPLAFQGTPFRRVEATCTHCGKNRMATAHISAHSREE